MTKTKKFLKVVADTLSELHLYKEKLGCFDCRNHYPHYVLEFDHKPEFHKIDVVYRVLRTMGPTAAWEEVSKCDVVCANCHKIRTYQRENSKYDGL